MIARIAVAVLLVAAGVLLVPALGDGFEGVTENASAAKNLCVRTTCTPNTPVSYWCQVGTVSARCGTS